MLSVEEEEDDGKAVRESEGDALSVPLSVPVTVPVTLLL